MNEARPTEDSGIPIPAPETPAPDEGSTATTQEPTAIELDPAGEYLVGKNKVRMLGTQVMNEMARGSGYSALQGQFDALQSQMSEMEGVAEENATLRQQLQDIDTNKRLEELVRARAPAPQSPATAESDAWAGYEQPAAPPQADPAELARTIQDVTEQVADGRIGGVLENIDAYVDQRVQQAMEEANQQATIQTRQRKWATDQRETAIGRYVDGYGFSPAEAAVIADNEAEAQIQEREARDLYLNGYHEEAANKFEAAQSIKHNVVVSLAKQSRTHEDAQQQLALREQVESGNYTAPETQAPEKHKVLWDPQEIKAERKAALARDVARTHQKIAVEGQLGPGLRITN